MKHRIRVATLGAALSLALSTSLTVLPAHAQSKPSFPTKPVRTILGAGPGSGADVIARLMGAKLSERWSHPVVVENRTGATASLALRDVARSTPDGHTYTISGVQSLMAMLLGTGNTDIPRELAPVSRITTQPFMIIAYNGTPARTLGEFIAYAKASEKEGRQISFSSAGIGGTAHVSMELFLSMAGIKVTHIPYKTTAPSMTDLMSGRVAITTTAILTAAPLARSGKVRPLAVTSAQRAKSFPDVPTVSETVPGYEFASWYGVWTTAGTPADIIAILNRDVAAVFTMPDVIEKMAVDGSEPVPPNSPAEFKKYIDDEVAKWDKFFKSSKIDFKG